MVAKWMPIAQSYQGEEEIRGPRDNPKIVEMFKDVGHGWVKDDETPWCAAFVGAVLEKAGYKGTGSLAARSYLNWGQKVSRPQYGDIVVFWRGKKSGWQGHVGFFIKETKSYIYVLGGNQANEVNVSRYSKSRLLGFRRPSSMKASRTVTGAGGVAVGTAIEQVSDKVKDTQDILLGFPVEWIQYIGIGLVVASLGLVLYSRWDDITKKGR